MIEDIKIVEDFNKKNKYRDGGKINNAIEKVLSYAKFKKHEHCWEELKKYVYNGKTMRDAIEYKQLEQLIYKLEDRHDISHPSNEVE